MNQAPSTNAKSLLVVMDPIAQVTYYKDTTLALLLAAQARGFELWYAEPQHLYLEQGMAAGRLRKLRVFADETHWFELEDFCSRSLGEIDVLLMRKDPPVDTQFIYTTYILEQAEREGCLVVNRPHSLRDCNEKVFATQFPQCCPPTLVARDMPTLRAFAKQHGDVIFKPLDGMGGSGIFRCREDDPNVSVILETLTGHGQQFIMGQRYIADIKKGDKRILVVDGEAVAYSLARIPADGETRGNLAAGGRGVAQPLTERDWWIVNEVAPTLKEKGLLFVGLDVIGDYLTEINITSPTCVREIDRAFDTRIGDRLMDAIENRLQHGGTN